MHMAIGRLCFAQGAARAFVCLHKPLAAPGLFSRGHGPAKAARCPRHPGFGYQGKQICFTISAFIETYTLSFRFLCLFSWQPEGIALQGAAWLLVCCHMPRQCTLGTDLRSGSVLGSINVRENHSAPQIQQPFPPQVLIERGQTPAGDLTSFKKQADGRECFAGRGVIARMLPYAAGRAGLVQPGARAG